MSGRAEAIQEELEALESMYPEGLRVTHGHDARAQTTVALDVAPRTLDDETRQYVRVTLRIVLDNDYPAGAPSLSLTDAKGLDDARLATVMGRLRDAVDEHAAPGDPVLALLCETAFETLTELNHPDGDCAFCLEPMWRADHPSSLRDHSAEAFTKLAKCYHCFHASCFARWYRWRAAAAAEEDALSGAHPLGSEEAESRSKRPTHLCPVCRCAVDDADAERVRSSLTGVGDDPLGFGVTGASSEAVSSAVGLTEDERAALRAQRARFEEAMERQRTAGGIVGDGDGEGIDLASASAASAAASAAAAGAGSNDGVDATRAPGGKGRSRGGGRGRRKPGAGGGRGGEVAGSIPGGENRSEPVRNGQTGGAGGGGLDWLKRAAASSAPFVPPAPNSSVDSVERGMREVSVDGGRGGGTLGRGRGSRREKR